MPADRPAVGLALSVFSYVPFIDRPEGSRVRCVMEKHGAPPRRVALVGMPASGKSSVGAVLARLLRLPFVDLDEAIERDAGMSVPEVFRVEGEPGFRDRESRVLAGLAAGDSVVLATGGGCVESAANRRLLSERFTCVWLKAGLAALELRAAGGARPLLNGDAAARLATLAARRLPLYEECASLSADTEGKGPSAVAEEIYASMR